MLHKLKQQLDQQVKYFNHTDFIADDPIFIPHLFKKKQDIEIAAFISATIAWGQRKTIIRSGLKIMKLMDSTPFDFIMGFSKADVTRINGFVHRTFNSNDLIYFIQSLRNIYINHGGLECVFAEAGDVPVKNRIMHFRKVFFELGGFDHSSKHVSNPDKGSAAKRLNMFLRWMVRFDNVGVDFGIWKFMSPSQLMCPLDVHSGRTARSIGILNRKINDWTAVEELTEALRLLNPNDPIVYDYALFGMGVKKLI